MVLFFGPWRNRNFGCYDGDIEVCFYVCYGRDFGASVFDRRTGDLITSMGGSVAYGERSTKLMALREAMRLHKHVRNADVKDGRIPHA